MRFFSFVLGLLFLALAVGSWYGVGLDQTFDDLEVPQSTLATAFSAALPDSPAPDSVAQVEISADWDNDQLWFGVVDGDQYEACAPDSNGLSATCQADDIEFIAGGPDSNGSFVWAYEAGTWHVAVGALSDGLSTTTTSVTMTFHTSTTVPVSGAIGAIGLLLLLNGVRSRPDRKIN